MKDGWVHPGHNCEAAQLNANNQLLKQCTLMLINVSKELCVKRALSTPNLYPNIQKAQMGKFAKNLPKLVVTMAVAVRPPVLCPQSHPNQNQTRHHCHYDGPDCERLICDPIFDVESTIFLAFPFCG